MKLLAKNAEDRYQSAAGLKFDLETCWHQLHTTGKIENFPVGQRDRGNQIKVHLNPGDVVVLYKDGITEAVTINRVYYGIERLCQVAKGNRHKTVE
jgi:hypothetical protein